MAVLPGAWNPPTVAHIAVARAALIWADEVVLTLPSTFPHKAFEGVSAAARQELLCHLAASEPGLSVATTTGGLYLEMAQEATEFFEPATEVGLVCGRDAAERIAAWDYGRPGVFEEMITRHPLLVAARAGDYVPSPRFAARIVHLPVPLSFSEVSSTEVRRRLAAGEPWQHLVPAALVSRVAALYLP